MAELTMDNKTECPSVSPEKPQKVLLLYSGGTDSTLCAALLAQKYSEVHLLTLSRRGIFNIKNSACNVKKLRAAFKNVKFIHTIKSCENFFRFLSYERFFTNIRKFGFFNLSTCGICKLSMHISAIEYALENSIALAADGANQGMDIYPAQMKEVIVLIRELYTIAGLTLVNPVFHLDGIRDNDFLKRLDIDVKKNSGPTAGKKLYKMGLMPEENVKGSDLDRKMQAQCFGLILFHIFAKWYFLENHSMQEYIDKTVQFYNFKIKMLTPLIKELKKKGKASFLGRISGRN
jgi:hypothetical protein